MLLVFLKAGGHVRICTEEVAVAASAPHLPFHLLLMKTMAVCSSFCSPEGASRQTKGRWEGAQRGCGQGKLCDSK